MGADIDVEAILPCNCYTMFVERDSAAFRALLSKSFNLGNLRFRDTWTTKEGSVFVRLVTKPEIASWVPSAVRSAVASASEIEFHDIIEYRPADITGPAYTLHIRTESPFLGDKLSVKTTLSLTPITATTTRQRLRGTVRVSMFGVGGIIERAIRDNLVKTYSRLPAVVARWEAFRAQVMRGGDNVGVLLAGRPPVGGDLQYIQEIKAMKKCKEKGNSKLPSECSSSTSSRTTPTKECNEYGSSIRDDDDAFAVAERQFSFELIAQREILEINAERKKSEGAAVVVVAPLTRITSAVVDSTNDGGSGSGIGGGTTSRVHVEATEHREQVEEQQQEEKNEILLDSFEKAALAATAAMQRSRIHPHHVRKTSDSLVLDSLLLHDITPPIEDQQKEKEKKEEQQRRPSTLSTLFSNPRHLRGFSWTSSAGSESDRTETPTALESRTPGSRGATAAWSRFNREYAAWQTFWEIKVGVRAGLVQMLIAIWHVLKEVVRVLAIFMILGLLRIGVLRVAPHTTQRISQQCSEKRSSQHRRSLSAPPAAETVLLSESDLRDQVFAKLERRSALSGTRRSALGKNAASPSGFMDRPVGKEDINE